MAYCWSRPGCFYPPPPPRNPPSPGGNRHLGPESIGGDTSLRQNSHRSTATWAASSRPAPVPCISISSCHAIGSLGRLSATIPLTQNIVSPSPGTLMLQYLCEEHGWEPEILRYQHYLVFACLWERGWRLRCTHTICSLMCVPVVVCVARKLHLCPSYSRRRDRINLVLLRSLYQSAGGVCC